MYVSMENFSEGGCWHFVQQAGGKAFIIIHQKKEEKIKDLCSFPVTLWFHLKKKADSHCTKHSAAVEAPQPVKHFSPILHLFSLMFCDAPQEKCFYWYFTNCLHVSQIREVIRLVIPHPGKEALEELVPKPEPNSKHSLLKSMVKILDLHFSAGHNL